MTRDQLKKDMPIRLEGNENHATKDGVVTSVNAESFCVVWNNAEMFEGKPVQRFYVIERDLPYFQVGAPLS